MNDIKERNQSLRKIMKTNRMMLGFIWKEKKGKLYVFLRVMIALINAIASVLYAVIPGLIINELINFRRISILIMFMGLLALTPIATHLINMMFRLRIHKLFNEMRLELIVIFFDYTLSMDYETLEKPDIQRLKRRAEDALQNVFNFVDIVAEFFSSIFSIAAMSSIILTLNPLIILLVLCVVFINSLVAKKVNYKAYLLEKESDIPDSQQDVYRFMIGSVEYAKEIRLFSLKSFLIKKYAGSQSELNELSFKILKNSYNSSNCNTITSSVQQIILYSYLIYNVISRGLAIGNMTIYMNAVGQLSGSLSSAFTLYLQSSRNSLDIQDYIEFINIPLTQQKTGNKTPSVDEKSSIEFRNVSFKYPGSDNYALKNVNVVLNGNEKLCIVGANGSGKSTFIKLLTRLYFPTEGAIFLNGVNINEYNYEEYQRMFSPVFQDFCRYYFSIRENIVLSDEYNQERLDEICNNNKLTSLIDKLNKGYDTQVGKWIDPEGFEPSGGEEQKIAIARALYHNAPIFLLDEPTAALDPIAEHEVYMQFYNEISDKTAVIITHRLSAVQLADKVAVFEDGSIVEHGTHKQLYENGGIYTEMFDKQSQFYRDANINLELDIPN